MRAVLSVLGTALVVTASPSAAQDDAMTRSRAALDAGNRLLAVDVLLEAAAKNPRLTSMAKQLRLAH
jgi:hypothetical protein